MTNEDNFMIDFKHENATDFNKTTNVTGVVIITGSEYDAAGALTFTVVTILIYALGMFAFIASHIKKGADQKDDEAQIAVYLKQDERHRAMIRQQSLKKLKDTAISKLKSHEVRRIYSQELKRKSRKISQLSQHGQIPATNILDSDHLVYYKSSLESNVNSKRQEVGEPNRKPDSSTQIQTTVQILRDCPERRYSIDIDDDETSLFLENNGAIIV